MTADQVRNYKVQPITLAWAILEHNVPTDELKNFTLEELQKIRWVASYEVDKKEIDRLLQQ